MKSLGIEADDGRTWGGQSFEMPDGKPIGTVIEEEIEGGVVTLQSSEVVLLSLEY